ncbi:putative glutamate decarboxylase [Lyophyllum shimeji]|uniref:Glutamate decarboxylase n=1 Tax=Lyophyllum shimeji TaxID=47721 RepID=A0A9P3PFX7_LYOSH|nr:putative glutamate decarboxylase [Lyophyllum shimeji]
MALSRHVNPDRLIQEAHDKKLHGISKKNVNHVEHTYGARYNTSPVPKYSLSHEGINAEAAYQIIHDELSLDGSPVLNLASFVHTWMPPEADKLFIENMAKNLIDCDEYPTTQAIHTRCVSILADLWHAPSAKNAIGTATTGSSEAIQLGGLAMKKIWQQNRKAAGKSIHEPGPNVIMGANAQVALEKFARYFDVECRLVPVSVESHYRLDPKKAMDLVDENTIGVFVILGSTYTGHYEPVKEMSDLLDEYEARTGHSVPIHVDAASGGFIAPFATPKLVWDFKLPRVVSINASGHKFGLSYVGVGWVVWRDKEHLPKDLIFELHYLGSVEYSFSLNFSRPAAPIIAQYFNFIHLGYEGYRNVALDDLKNARLLSRALEGSKYFTVLSDIHRKVEGAAKNADDGNIESYTPGLPVVSFRFSDSFKENHPEVQQRWVQTLLRAKGWIVPNYELPPGLDQVEILRVVVRESMTEPLVDQLIADIIDVAESLAKESSPAHALTMLGAAHHKRNRHEHEQGRLEEGSGSAPSGTFLSPDLIPPTSMPSADTIPVPPVPARPATAVLEPAPTTPSFRINTANKSYRHQAHKRWRDIPGNPILVPRVLEVVKSRLCYIIGTVYMDMPLKPNVMEDIARDHSIPPPPPHPKFYSPEDNVMLEDESGRIRLVGERLKAERLVTGVIIGTLGAETPNGDFEVVDLCYPGMAPQTTSADEEPKEENKMHVDGQTSSADEWIALVSGLDIGSSSRSDAQLQMLVEYLTGEGGGVTEQVSAAQISRLIIAGNSMAPLTPSERGEPDPEQSHRKPKRYGQEAATFSPHPVLTLSDHLFDIAATIPKSNVRRGRKASDLLLRD